MSDTPQTRTGERIAKLLARAGIASRREVERLIEAGRVKIGDEVVTTANTVLTSLRGVTVDDKPVKAAEAARLFVFHKPAGLLTAERDPAGRPTIYTALRNALPADAPRVMPVGRLDFNTEGLLMLTNDGELKRAMELPSSGIPRTYRARTFGPITQAQLEDLIEGIEIDGFRYGKIDANMERSAGHNQWIELTLTEGKNREVRRVLEHLGLEVSRLLRTSYGPFELLDLPRGAAVEIRQVDVERFVKSLKAGGDPAEIKRITSWAKSETRPEARTEVRPDARPAPARAAPRREDDDRRTAAPASTSPGGRGRREAPGGGREDRDRRTAAPASASPGGRGRREAPDGARGATERRPPRGAPATTSRRAPSFPRPGQDERAGGASEKAARPARKSDERDRGEKLLDRPKPPRKPSGWAKAAPRKKTGPRKSGPPKGPRK